MGRRAPRSISAAIGTIRTDLTPPNNLAAIQVAWAEVVGEGIAAVTKPVSEREGTLTIHCVDAVWAEELNLMRDQLLGRLTEVLGPRAPRNLRMRTGSIED